MTLVIYVDAVYLVSILIEGSGSFSCQPVIITEWIISPPKYGGGSEGIRERCERTGGNPNLSWGHDVDFTPNLLL